MVGLLIVSHSAKAAEGICELAGQMAGEDCRIVAAGGMEDGSLGTDALRIRQGIIDADAGDGVVILADLGSSILSSRMAIELLEEEGEERKAVIADAPILEGAVSAAVEASAGGTLEETAEAAGQAKELSKLN